MSADDAGAPVDGAAVLTAIRAAVGGRGMNPAIALAQAALNDGLEHPEVLNLVAYKFELDERIIEALDLLQRANRLAPNDPYVLNSIGVCLSKLDRPREAISAFEAALIIAPDFAHAHNGRGLALASLGEDEAAEAAQQRAAQLDSQFPEPRGALASLAVERKDWRAARDHAAAALALDPDQPAAAMAMAAIDLNDAKYEDAETRMSRLIGGGRLTHLHLAGAQYIRADALEALKRRPEAMSATITANAETRRAQLPVVLESGGELGVEMAERLIAKFEREPKTAWESVPDPAALGGEAAHVFLVGFPRSGTTLLEQVLASHGDVVALEEKFTLEEPIRTWFKSNDRLDVLSRLGVEEADELREHYWRQVRSYGAEPAGKIFIDKQPLYGMYLPLIAKLFPKAKILFARRDPRDVVISCFKKRFLPNPMVIEFTDLERTAQVYAGAMRLAEIYDELLDLPVHIHRHENLIDNFDEETQAICDFIGVPWDANMRNFVETANRRDIRTPSADQVRRGLNRDGVGQWRSYGQTVDVIKPILAPWAAKFGYPQD